MNEDTESVKHIEIKPGTVLLARVESPLFPSHYVVKDIIGDVIYISEYQSAARTSVLRAKLIFSRDALNKHFITRFHPDK